MKALAAPADAAGDAGGELPQSVSQTVKAQLALRELILGGELKPGARIAELWLVERLEVSRTPVRMALVKLAEEGLLDALPAGGYAVKAFSEADIQDAIELRGTLEGLAARLAAERGVSPVLLTEARECVARIDAALAEPALTEATFGIYVEEKRALPRAARRDVRQQRGGPPARKGGGAAPSRRRTAFVMAQSVGPHARDVLVVAQEQHRMLIEAITQHEGSRAEALMREHARIARRNLQQAFAQPAANCAWYPAPNLIRQRKRPPGADSFITPCAT